MVHQLTFPTTLTDEEIQLKRMFEILRKIKSSQQRCLKSEVDSAGVSCKVTQKIGVEDAEVATEQVKKLVKTGAMTISKTEEKHTFKRSRKFDRQIKIDESSPTIVKKFRSTESSNATGQRTANTFRPPHLSEGFVASGRNAEESGEGGRTIYIRGYDLMEESLRSSFEKFGTIGRVYVEDRRRSAFIDFMESHNAEEAIKEMDGNMINGITLRVSMARRQNYAPWTGSRGPFGGRRPRGSWTANQSGSRRPLFDYEDRSSGQNYRNQNRDIVMYEDDNTF